MMGLRKLAATVLIIAIIAVGARFVVIPGVAQANERWAVLGSFGLSPGDPEPLSGPTWLAIDQSTGDVYVVDAANNRVERFGATGAYLGQFDGSGSFEVEGKKETSGAAPSGVLSGPGGIAVDNDPSSPSFGDVYVIDAGHNVVDKFTATGAYLGQLTGTCPSRGLCTTSTLVPFAGLAGVAVDTAGVVRVENGAEHSSTPVLDSFSDEQPNAYLAGREAVTGGAVKPGLAVDSEDDVYLIYQEGRIVAKLDSAGEKIGERLDGVEGASDVAVETGTNDLFIDTGSSVVVLNPAASLIEGFGSGLLDNAAGVAVNPAAGASGYAYVTQPADDNVLLFERGTTSQAPPVAPTTTAASSTTAHSATLNGELNPEGAAGGVGYYFSYNTGGAGCTEPGSLSTPLDNGAFNPTGSSEVSVSASLTGLVPSTEYTFCLLAAKFGATPGAQQSFTTSGAEPEVISQSAANFEEGRAHFKAVINPNHSKVETTYSFEYSTEGSVTGNMLGGMIKTIAGEGSVPAEEYGEREVMSMKASLPSVEDTYYYRIVVTNETGTTDGEVQAYTKAPILSGGSSSSITLSSAKLEAAVYPNFQSTKYGFQYSTSRATVEAEHGTLVAGASEVGGGEEEEVPPTPVAVEVGNLQENTTYYYRSVGENASSENPSNPGDSAPSTGTILSFTTESLPFVTTGQAEDVNRTSGALSGSVTPIDQATIYYFQYIPEASYQAALAKDAADPYAEGETTMPLNLTASSEPHVIGPVAANGLLPEMVYHYRLAAKNEWGVRYGADQTFTTTAKVLPEVSTGPPSGVTQTTATLTGTVTTNGLATNYGFDIATAPGDYGPATGLRAISDAITEATSETLTELQPGTTYYYRLTATNADGIVNGTEQAFTTTALSNILSASITLPPLAAIPSFELLKEEPQKLKAKLTKAQLLSKALKACKKDKTKASRSQCEKRARQKYGPAKKHRSDK